MIRHEHESGPNGTIAEEPTRNPYVRSISGMAPNGAIGRDSIGAPGLTSGNNGRY